MKVRKNGFFYFALSVYGAAVFYLLATGVNALGQGMEDPFMLQGVFLFCLLLLWLSLAGAGYLLDRFTFISAARRRPRLWRIMEAVGAAAVLCASFVVRIRYVQEMPMQPESDFQTYYEIAGLLHSKTLLTAGTGYCDYIALFPHVLGYPKVLATVFSLFGQSVAAAQYLNVVLATGSVYAVWRIARRLGGRTAGFAALCASAFWPSQILFMNFAASEYLFSFLLLLCVWLFLVTMQDFDGETPRAWLCVLLLCALGFLLAFCGSVRPLAVLYLISVLICMAHCKMTLPEKLTDNLPLALRFISRGWRRCLLVLGVYLACSSFFSMRTAYTIDRTPASGSASFGYNLLVGLNTESDGGWNQKDSQYLTEVFEATGSAQEAHEACREQAFIRIRKNPAGLFNLVVKKYGLLWSNDNYGVDWNLLFMEQQGTLTLQRRAFYDGAMKAGNLYYLLAAVLSAVGGVFWWHRKAGPEYSLFLLFLGTAALHLILESQNRYHFHVCYLFAIFAGLAVSYLVKGFGRCSGQAREEKERAARAEAERGARMMQLQRQEQEWAKLREQAMKAQFDLGEALREHHVGITVSRAVAEGEPSGKHESSKKEEES